MLDGVGGKGLVDKINSFQGLALIIRNQWFNLKESGERNPSVRILVSILIYGRHLLTELQPYENIQSD